jgi:hypothetical protein
MTSTIGGAVEDGKQKSRSRLNIGVREKVMESETMAEYLVGAVELAECGQDSFASSVVTVENSLHWCDAHFAVSSTGELACLTLYPEAYSPWVSHKYVDFNDTIYTFLIAIYI